MIEVSTSILYLDSDIPNIVDVALTYFTRAMFRILYFFILDLKRLGEGIFLKRHLISDLQRFADNGVRAIFKVTEIV